MKKIFLSCFFVFLLFCFLGINFVSADNIFNFDAQATAKNTQNTILETSRIIEKLTPTNFLSYTVNYLVDRGVSADNLILILMLPVIAMVVSFTRQFLGIKTFGIYTPTIITLSFVATGLRLGLIFFIVILVLATLMRFVLKRTRLLYLPRMAILLTILTLAILIIFILGTKLGYAQKISLSVFPVLILIILSEKFIAAQIEKGGWKATLLSLETILVSTICYFLVTWPWFKNFIFNYPEVVLLTLVINLLLGKWVGLRLSEYLRFKELRKFTKKAK